MKTLLIWLAMWAAEPDTIEAPTAVGISGETEAVAGADTLIRLNAEVPEGHTVTWLPLSPRHGLDSAYCFVEAGGTVWGCATPTKPTTIKVQLLDWSAQSWAFHEVAVKAGPDEGDDDDNPPPPPPPPADKLVVIIVEESETRGPDIGDMYNELQRDADLAKHSLTIIDDDQSGVLAQYVALVAERPGIIVDVDWSPSEVRYVGACPRSVEGVKALLSKFTSAQAHPAPHEGGQRLQAPVPTPRSVAPVPQRRKARYVWRTEPDGSRWGVDTETGTLYPVNERTSTFCIGDRCFKVPRK